MLIEFNVANYRSFKDRVTLSMLATNDDSLQESNVIVTEKRQLLKSVVVYGANASGKSNLLNAMRSMRRMVLTSSKDTQANEDIDVESFKLSTESDGKPCLFEIVFVQNNCTYRYGFEADRKRVHSEWLFNTPRTKEAQLFVREGKQFEVNSKRFKEGQGLEGKTRENALFLSVCAQWNGEISKNLLSWFRDFSFIHGLYDYTHLRTTVNKLTDITKKRWILEMTKLADLSIDDIEGREERLTYDSLPDDMPEEVKKEVIAQEIMTVELKTVHKKFGENGTDAGTVVFDLEENESGGTQKFLNLAGPLLETIETGKLLVIDELDARLHPLLTRAVVKLFNSAANSKNAQLIFASHDINLLSNKIFRRDQVWFTEKDQFGATNLYSLIELQKVRKKASFGKDYILGKYGAIPFIGDPKWFFCEEINGKGLAAETTLQ